jgi:phage-related protein
VSHCPLTCIVKVQSTLTEGFGDLMKKQIRVLTSLLLVYTQCLQKIKEVTTSVKNWKGKFQGQSKYFSAALKKFHAMIM